jgi:predicted RNase H-like nuclease (RuvC/YqgF family)
MSSNAKVVKVDVVAQKLELLDQTAKALTKLIKQQEQKIQELTRHNQQLENLQSLRRNCKCVSTTEFYHAIHEKHCHCTWCDPAGN